MKTLEMYTGAHLPKRQFEELVQRAAQDFEAFYAQRQTDADADGQTQTGSILVLTVDGKGVVMLPEDLREATQRAAAQRAQTFTARLGGGRRLHAKRMAAVAAIYTVEPFVRTPEQILPESRGQETGPARPRPEHKRVWASLAQSPEDVIEEMFDEAARRDPQRQKRWVALVDGNLPQIAHLERLAEKRGVPLIIVIDFIHVAQYVWKAAGALFPGQEFEQDRWTRQHLLEILRGKASRVAAGIRRSATLRQMGAERKPVDECADYLLHYSPYLHYDKALAEGVPIATGVIEGACRHLIEDRMNLTGARWSLTGAEAVLRLRALRSSGDFDAYWKFHEQQEYERHHASRYAGHRVPEIVPPVATSSQRSRPSLKIVSRKGDS
jgi:hypothetical protein